MKNIRKMAAAAMLTAVFMVGTSFGQKGLLVSDFAGNNQNPCTQEIGKDRKGVILQDFTGILVQGFTGILVQGFTGILVQGAAEPTVSCGVMLAD